MKLNLFVLIFMFPLVLMAQPRFGIAYGIMRNVDVEKPMGYYSNYLRFPVGRLCLEPRIGFANASNYKPGDEVNWFHTSYSDLELNLLLNPVSTGRFKLYVGGGFGVRKRGETIPFYIKFYYVDGVEVSEVLAYTTRSGYITGSSFYTDLEFKLNSRFNLDASLVLKTYDLSSMAGVFIGITYLIND